MGNHHLVRGNRLKPHVILHMMSSLDGRIVTKNWPRLFDYSGMYEEIHRKLNGDAWIVGRVTMAEFAQGDPQPVASDERLPRTTWRAPGVVKGPFAVALDAHGKLHLNTGRVNGDAPVMVLTEQVSDAHLAELQRDGISYLFAGTDAIDLSVAMNVLATEFGIRRLLLEGGGTINGGFLKADLIDEMSLLLCPFTDGETGIQSFIESTVSVPSTFSLDALSKLDHDVVHLKYKRNSAG
ncbi:RibD family protein [Caballeronia sp. GAWG2-1]|uniref:RibD family protein n=1 Tax=Caballeronia sp. GAWG2-1 TaxID=2921744 RepID=UPI0025401466|nr:RibD family protein [Caballeronia sp. GAWG2-1]